MNRLRSMIVLCSTLLLGWAFAQLTIHSQEKTPITSAAASAAQASFDQPLAWMKEAKANFGAVKDYSCVLTTRENLNGTLGEKNVIQFKMLPQPFCVHMKWLAPRKLDGQEVAYIEGKNRDRMRVKTPNRPLLGFVSIDVNDPRVRQNSRHTVREAGIGNMIADLLKAWEDERALGKSMVKTPVAAKMNEFDCLKVEVVRQAPEKSFTHYRTVVYLEKASKMPIHLENYAWPREGGPDDGELMEEFSYHKIEWNKGLKEAQFHK